MSAKPTQAEVMKAALQHQDALQAYAYGITRDWALAEDVVQNAFVIVMEKWTAFQPGTSAYHWTRAIVRLKALELLRARNREQPEEESVLHALTEQAMDTYMDEDAAQRQKELLRKLQRCMQQVTGRSLELVLQFYWKRLTYEQLAVQFNASVEGVRKNLYRVRRALQECVERQADPAWGQE